MTTNKPKATGGLQRPPVRIPARAKQKKQVPVPQNEDVSDVTVSESKKDVDPEGNPLDTKTDEKTDDEKTVPKGKAKKTKKTKPTTDKSKDKKSSKCSCKQCCKNLPKRICPYFPRCCQLHMQTCLQIVSCVDLIVTIINIGIWVYFHQYDPFTHNKISGRNKTDLIISSTMPPVNPSATVTIDISEFHETTTSIYGKELGGNVDGQGEGIKYSKIGYVYRRYQQEVENMCGRKYYSEYLIGYNLAITNGVFSDLLVLTYLSECMYQFIDISILVTTCCFFEYTSGRLFLIIIWNMELLPVLAKLYIIVESRSHRLCILQYGLGKNYRGLDFLLLVHFLPLLLFRAYKLLVFTYFVGSVLELGNLEHQTRIQGATLHEYVERHEEYVRMDKNRDRSSSDGDDVDNV